MPASLRERALRHLAQRDHARQELTRKLAAHGSQEEVAEVLERLEELGLLGDGRYAEGFVRARAGRFGAARLGQDLARKGVDRDTIEQALAAIAPEDELGRARAVWARKFASAPADPREWARQARFLQGRGFATETIRKVLKDCHDEPA
jgi:regulatory protein